ncbi:MAG: hypothetical protein GX946_05505 [Oligosphaeraceae bacterium]|nr:hypothetical protein [Oligosphaeraceae bacterium]
MAAKHQKILEISILELQVDSYRGKAESNHVMSATLLYPRPAIAMKKCEKQVNLQDGVFDWRQESWCKRIMFKEVCDFRFGLEISLSEAMSKSEMAEFARFMAGRAMRLGANELDDIIPAGDLVVLPLHYYSQNLLKNKAMDIIILGDLDLEIAQFEGHESLQLEIPLYSERKLVKRQRVGGRKGPVRYSSKTLLEKGARDGVASVLINVL